MLRTLARGLCPLLLVVVVAAGAAAQSTGQSKEKHDMSKMDHQGGGWKEMDAFHKVLAATYHPVAKDSLQPLRAKAADLASAAEAWSASKPPMSCQSAEVLKSVSTLATQAKSLEAEVKAGAVDANLKTSITALHGLFESVEMKCGGHEMKGQKHH